MKLYLGIVKQINNFKYASKEVKASTVYMLCSILQKCLTMLTMPLFTRLMPTDEYGYSTVYASTMAVIIIFTSLQLPYGSFSPAMIKFENDRDGYISAVCMICTCLTGLYYCVFILCHGIINKYTGLPSGIMLIMGAEMLMSTAQQLWMGKQRFEYRYKSVAVVTLLSSFLSVLVAFVAVTVVSVNKGVIKVYSSAGVIILFGMVLYVREIVRGKALFNRKYWKYALSFNIPLIPYYLSQVIFNQSDRLMINAITGRSDAAKYGVAYSLALVLTFVINAVNNSYLPWLYQKIKNGNTKDNRTIALAISTAIAVLIMGIIALGPELILVFGGRKYNGAEYVIPPVAMSLLLLFYSQQFINIEFYYEQKYKLVGASIIAAVTNIILNYYGIKMFGYIAAGYTTLISYMIFTVSNYWSVKKILKEEGSMDDLYDIKGMFLLASIFMAIGVLFTLLYPLRLIRFTVIIVAIVLVFIKRKKIIIGIQSYKNRISR